MYTALEMSMTSTPRRRLDFEVREEAVNELNERIKRGVEYESSDEEESDDDSADTTKVGRYSF